MKTSVWTFYYTLYPSKIVQKNITAANSCYWYLNFMFTFSSWPLLLPNYNIYFWIPCTCKVSQNNTYGLTSIIKFILVSNCLYIVLLYWILSYKTTIPTNKLENWLEYTQWNIILISKEQILGLGIFPIHANTPILLTHPKVIYGIFKCQFAYLLFIIDIDISQL